MCDRSSWARRSGKTIIDGVTIVKLILFECDILSDVFLATVLASAIFVTYTYKGQQLPYYSVFNDKQVLVDEKCKKIVSS